MINKYLQKLIKEIKITKALLRSRSASNGMTYVELIVVLSIFSVLSSVAIYNYGDFQDNVDIKNVGSDIALKIVEAQKSATNGVLPNSLGYTNTWKPAYGVYFDINPLGKFGINRFVYFVDLDNSNSFNAGEKLETLDITKNNFISAIDVFDQNDDSTTLEDLTVIFTRPNSAPELVSGEKPFTSISHIQITIESPKGKKSLIKVYSSGRIQVN